MNNFLYIDDNTRDEADGLIVGLSDEKLSIEFRNPTGNWENERIKFLSEEFRKYDGLLLDLNLEEKKNPESGTISYYKGSTLAQELRNLSKSKEMSEIPIFLLSANKNLDKYFDETNKDLFDLIISKESLSGSDAFKTYTRKLIAIAEAYKFLSGSKDVNSILNSETDNEDVRFISEMEYQVRTKPLHSISNFFIKEILQKNGILICENLLFSRLGIDLDASAEEHVATLKDKILIKIKYEGIFSSGWERWWMSKLEKLWNEISENRTLRSLDAQERVEILNKRFNLDLKASKKDGKAKSSKFWTFCKGTGTYIDNIDGLLVIGQEKIYPWQDKEYICFEEALQPTNKEIWKDIIESEKIKLEMLKRKFPNERPSR
ncbi:hypothetical protein [Flavobacterium aquidurense]|uniref:hypothetical protein n=1 Tax=Flavobacterium aquidurense TaxID=362413 RepID=UPI000918490E|nr:hypothetical protein [Flavobacterium aquidurense]SHG69238.1 hypothetical protein SAMN05444481_106211 [Flavobacterium frigidimaris]